jgi:hypothetical protein
MDEIFGIDDTRKLLPERIERFRIMPPLVARIGIAIRMFKL